MARNHGRILTSIWDNEDFRTLQPLQQRLYLFLLSQPNLSHAGLLPVTLRRWAAKAADLTPDQILEQLRALAAARFIVLDEDAEELLIRTLIRNDNVWRQPNVMAAAAAAAVEITSPLLRGALLVELDTLPLDELSDTPARGGGLSIRARVADSLTALRAQLGSQPGSGTPPPAPSEGPSKPTGKPSGGVPGTPPVPESRVPHGRPESMQASALPQAHPKPSRNPSRGVPETPYAHAGALSPTPTPSTDFVGALAPAAPSAQDLVGEWLAALPERPPGQVIGRVGKQLRTMAAEGIATEHLRRGLAAWTAKGQDPTSLPSFVNQAMNGAAAATFGNVVPFRGASTADQRTAAAFDLASRLAQEGPA